MKAPVPVLRSFDARAAREFYVDFLGFEVLFEHRLTVTAPLYIGLQSGACELHLSEHFGDATPGSLIRIEIEDVAAFCARLLAKNYAHAKPSWQRQEWGWDEMCISDPAGNRLMFVAPHS